MDQFVSGCFFDLGFKVFSGCGPKRSKNVRKAGKAWVLVVLTRNKKMNTQRILIEIQQKLKMVVRYWSYQCSLIYHCVISEIFLNAKTKGTVATEIAAETKKANPSNPAETPKENAVAAKTGAMV